jgi:hypothetical protein
MNYQNIGIAYFTNPAIENEPFGKEVDGIMTSVARQLPVRKINTYSEVSIVEEMKPTNLPSIIFTDNSGKTQHLKIEGQQLSGITLAKVLETVGAIDKYNKTSGL